MFVNYSFQLVSNLQHGILVSEFAIPGGKTVVSRFGDLEFEDDFYAIDPQKYSSRVEEVFRKNLLLQLNTNLLHGFSRLRRGELPNEYFGRNGHQIIDLIRYSRDLEIELTIKLGSIIWQDGKLTISNGALALLLVFLTGGYEALANYEDARRGVSLLYQDIQSAYVRIAREFGSVDSSSSLYRKVKPMDEEELSSLITIFREYNYSEQVREFLEDSRRLKYLRNFEGKISDFHFSYPG